MIAEETVFPPHGFVRLLGYTGSELDVVNAARVSFHKESSEMDKSAEGLIGYLMKNRHGSPFEMGFVSRWHIRVPIFVMREWVRHRMASYNEESGRYTELRDDFFYPQALRTQKGKPGAYHFESLDDEETKEWFDRNLQENSRRAFALYRHAIEKGVAREQARLALPLNLYTEFRWNINSRSLMNFLSLRTAPDAQAEIREYALAVERMWAAEQPVVHSAWNDCGRQVP